MYRERARTITVIPLTPYAGAGPEVEDALIGTVRAESHDVVDAGLRLCPRQSSQLERGDEIDTAATRFDDLLSSTTHCSNLAKSRK
jgi:hypothetical protein